MYMDERVSISHIVIYRHAYGHAFKAIRKNVFKYVRTHGAISSRID